MIFIIHVESSALKLDDKWTAEQNDNDFELFEWLYEMRINETEKTGDSTQD